VYKSVISVGPISVRLFYCVLLSPPITDRLTDGYNDQTGPAPTVEAWTQSDPECKAAPCFSKGKIRKN
jgi:hypothetical protein